MKFKYHKDGTKPTDIDTIFVFGSNLSAIHGAGAAREAELTFGASRKIPSGFSGHSYAIPTKDEKIKTMKLLDIEHYVNVFSTTTHLFRYNFFITRIGCGLAGFDDKDIAPLFKGCNQKYCSFAEEWMPYLEQNGETK